MVSVTDPMGVVTTYAVDDFGCVVQEVSPDAGTTSYVYDKTGNMVSKTDAMGITTSYTYDALNRLTGIDFPGASQDVVYTYDEGENGIGRLSGMVDPSGAAFFSYDTLGRLTEDVRIIDGVFYTTGYGYDAAGVLKSMTYPDGREVSYTLDAAGRIVTITTTDDTGTHILADSIAYLPFGPLSEMTLGNGTDIDKAFDARYRLTHLSAGGYLNRAYGMNDVGNITAITDLLDPDHSQTFTYDDLYRLTNATGVYGTIDYSYDKVGNRLSRTENGAVDTYSYVPGTNRLDTVTGAHPMQFAYDANGSTAAMGDRSLIYNQNNRLIQVMENAAVLGEYVYNARGQRIKKTTGPETTIFHWDQFGDIIGESDPEGKFLTTYAYLGVTRLAAFQSGGTPSEISIQVGTDEGRTLSGIKVYAFTESGAYTGKNAVTGDNGTAVFAAADFVHGDYQFRADYLSDQFWSDVIGIPGTYSASIDIAEEITTVSVTQAGATAAGVKVYLFNDSGTYLGQYRITDGEGLTFFVLPEGQGYTFRADLLGSRYFSDVVTVAPGQSAPVAVDAGGGLLTFTLKENDGVVMAGVRTYLFSDAGSYLGKSITTNAHGVAEYPVSSGRYTIRTDYLGYQHWSDTIVVTGDTAADLALLHKDVTITVDGDKAGDIQPREGVEVHLFTASGSYQGHTAVTDDRGQAVFRLPASKYKVRADYMGQQFWSNDFVQKDAPVVIHEGDVDITVSRFDAALEGVPVYVFSDSGSYLGLSGTSSGNIPLTFRLPAGVYNFRADYLGSQYFSGKTDLKEDLSNPVTISTGGGNLPLPSRKPKACQWPESIAICSRLPVPTWVTRPPPATMVKCCSTWPTAPTRFVWTIWAINIGRRSFRCQRIRKWSLRFSTRMWRSLCKRTTVRIRSLSRA